MFTLDQLLQSLPNAQVAQGVVTATAATPIHAVTSDSRAVTAGTLFVAVQGGSVDGHRYCAAAVAQGAVAVIGTHTLAALAASGVSLPLDLPYIQVADSRIALAAASAMLYGWPSRQLTVVGVTGTDGKTTTSTLIEAILTAATRTDVTGKGDVGVITTVAARIRGVASETGLHVTTPDAPEVQRYLAAMRDAGCRYAVVESTSHGLDQARVAMVDFDIAAVTNITHEHLDYHGTRDAYVQAKAKLFRALYHRPAEAGVPRAAVLNADDTGSYGALVTALNEEAMRAGFRVPQVAYGVREDADLAQFALDSGELDVVATAVYYSPRDTRFQIVWPQGHFELVSPLIGEFNVYNITCAASVALALGIAPAHIQAGVAEMAGVPGRMERIELGQEFLAIVDFAHSPASLERALRTLRPLVGQGPQGQPGRLIAVFGSAGLRDRAKRALMGQISGRLADFTLVTAEDPRTEELDEINAAIAAGVRQYAPENALAIVRDRAEAIQVAVDMARVGDVVAAFGKGHEQSMCFGTVEYAWSDQAAMRAALCRRLGISGEAAPHLPTATSSTS